MTGDPDRLAYRIGWALGAIPAAIQFGRRARGAAYCLRCRRVLDRTYFGRLRGHEPFCGHSRDEIMTARDRRQLFPEGYDPTHGRIDPDIQAAVEEMHPPGIGERVAWENTAQAQRDRRRG